jgi:hypothetical protein
MKLWYEEKRDFHHKQWAAAMEAGKEKAAAFHMQEYLNYQAMSEQAISGGGDGGSGGK